MIKLAMVYVPKTPDSTSAWKEDNFLFMVRKDLSLDPRMSHEL